MSRQDFFITFDPSNPQARAAALEKASAAASAASQVAKRSTGSNLFFNVSPNNVSVRDGYDRADYDSFRTGDALPRTVQEEIAAANCAYKKIGIVRNVIDLMSDFTVQGIDLAHPNEGVQKFYKEWFRRVRGKERSERFVNLVFRLGNVVVQRRTAKLPVRVERDMRRSSGEADMAMDNLPKVSYREVPWRYTFKNPLSLDVVHDELSLFVGQDELVYAVRIPHTLASKIRNPRDEHERQLVQKIPDDIRRVIQGGSNVVVLPPDKIRAFFYKKDDWECWASPMVSAILPDLQLLLKMKLADLSALDGAISQIRVWKLGNIDKGIVPDAAAFNHLAEILCNNVGGGVLDLVWGPELELIQTQTDVHHFLGETKYAPTLTQIYAGLGIPPTLTGAASNGGFTNNFISLKTLTERLQYARDLLVEFWKEEIKLVQKAMGFRFPASLIFDRMVLTDEAAEKRLLIDLADRDLISIETLQERFGETPEIEEVRTRREMRKRRKGKMPDKASPFHVADKEHRFKSTLLQQGVITPSQVGLDLDEPEPGEETFLDLQNKQEGVTQKGEVGQGRPKLSRDKERRKRKKVQPRSSARFIRLLGWAENAQGQIARVLSPAYLASRGKKSGRELTDEESAAFEGFKFAVLCSLAPYQEVDEQSLKSALARELFLPEFPKKLLEETLVKHAEKSGKEPPIEVLRRYHAAVYSLWMSDAA